MTERDNKMNKIMVIILSIILVFCISYITTSYLECDGKLVRGLFWLECIQEQTNEM